MVSKANTILVGFLLFSSVAFAGLVRADELSAREVNATVEGSTLAPEGSNTSFMSVLHKTSSRKQKIRDGKLYEMERNQFGQLVSAERVGGTIFKFGYADGKATQPNAIKIGKAKWRSVPKKKSEPIAELHTDSSATADRASVLNLSAQDSFGEAILAAALAIQLKGEPLPEDEVPPEGGTEFFEVYATMIVDDGGWGNGGSGGGVGSGTPGYCQSRHCSFPSLEACMADCARTRELGSLVCLVLGPLTGLVCQEVIDFGYNNICVPGCIAGNR
ncbi:MAG: hypothetical protein ACKO15_05110 [Burkholderiales bacterium]